MMPRYKTHSAATYKHPKKQVRLKWVVELSKLFLLSFLVQFSFACERHSVPSLSIYFLYGFIKFFLWLVFFGANCSLQIRKKIIFFCCERKTFGNFSLSVLLFIIKSMSYAFYGKAIWFMIIDTYVDGWDLFNIDDRSIGFIFNSFFLWE